MNLRWAVFLGGFVPSALILAVEAWGGGGFLLLPFLAFNPLCLVGLLITQNSPWLGQLVVLAAVSAFWWYLVAGTVDAIKRRLRRMA